MNQELLLLLSRSGRRQTNTVNRLKRSFSWNNKYRICTVFRNIDSTASNKCLFQFQFPGNAQDYHITTFFPAYLIYFLPSKSFSVLTRIMISSPVNPANSSFRLCSCWSDAFACSSSSLVFKGKAVEVTTV